ncbi:MAG: hypothetical protein K0B07_04220 [DPANN group archaeon]|nr:hypothetical protein [DPANN group archaeon]
MNRLGLNLFDNRHIKNSIFVLFAIIAIYTLSSLVLADNIVLNIGVDASNYIGGNNIKVYGFAFQSMSFISYANVSVKLINSEGITVFETTEVSDRFSFFASTFPAPYIAGQYDVVVTILETSATKSISITVPLPVQNIAAMQVELVEDSFVISSFNAPEDYSIIVNPAMMDTKATVYTQNTKQYYILLENTTGRYDRLYIDEDSDFTSNTNYLEEGSSVKIADEKYSIWYIDPKGNFVIFAKRIKHVFEPPQTQSELLVLALDSEADPILHKNIVMNLIDSEGNIEQSNILLGQTGQFGLLSTTLQLSQSPGTHTMVFNDNLATESYRIELFGLKVSVVDASGNPVFKVYPGDTIFMKASVFSSDDTLITEDLEKTEAKISGHKTLEKFILNPYIDGIFTGSYTIPTDIKGKFLVQFKFKYQDTQEVRKINFEIEEYDLSAYPISADFSTANIFAPGQENAIIISGKGTKDKKRIKLEDMTDDCDISNIIVKALYDKNNIDIFQEEIYRTLSISDYIFEKNIPNTIRNHLKKDYGDKSCVIIFNTPDTGGIYRLVASVNIDDEIKTISTSFKVDDMYLDIKQISFDENNNIIVPGSRVYFEVTATDALTGVIIPSEDIISADIIKTTIHDSKYIVTENMVDIEINSSYSENTTLVSFIANDSVTGYHSVEFRIYAEVTHNDGDYIVDATGYGQFREQMHTIKVTLEDPDKIYANTKDDVNMIVEIFGLSNNKGESLEVSIKKIINKMTGKKITSNSSCTMIETNCTIVIESPYSGWSNGGYYVTIDIDGDDEYTYGWFK